jgi:hypothetical protein
MAGSGWTVRFIALPIFSFSYNGVGNCIPKRDVLWKKLGVAIDEVDRSLDGVLGVAIHDLSTEQKFILRADELLPQASTIKRT